MTDYTVVEPHVVFIDPPNQDTYLEFLEMCTRTCYKSEEHIKLGSAEKLMGKVVNEYEHYSVCEHANAIFRFHGDHFSMRLAYKELTDGNPLIRKDLYENSCESSTMIMSGNVRMWMDFIKANRMPTPMALGLRVALHKKWPFFFNEYVPENEHYTMEILDENPVTNKDGLSTCMMKRHMTLTVKFVGDRSMSHQLVRHRLFAFSQESQRYCNYGKKGFQFIVPPTATNEPIVGDSHVPSRRGIFVEGALDAYERYLDMLRKGLPPEDARGLLPNCTKTEVVTTGTLGYWCHFFHHRGHNKKAQWQIRALALEAERLFAEHVPSVFTAPDISR